MHIRSLSVEEFFSRFDATLLVEEYAAECANLELPPPKPHRAMYEALEKAGIMHLLGVFETVEEGELLIGFASLIVNVNPHYSIVLAGTESIFVGKDHRGNGVGLALLEVLEIEAAKLGAVGFYMSAPKGGPLAAILPREAFRHTNEVFFKRLA